MALYALDGVSPHIDASAFVAPSADLIGQVNVAAQASVWFGAVLRGDREAIEVGEGSNVQDGAVLHSDPGFPCTLAQRVTVGHHATVHGAFCDEGSLVGMHAVMLNGSRLGRGAVLAAGALLPEGKSVPDGMLALGVPAKVVRPVDPVDNAQSYIHNARRYLRSMTRLPAETLQQASGAEGQL